MNNFKIIMDCMQGLQSFVNKEDQEQIDKIFTNVSDLRKKYECMKENEIIVLYKTDNNRDIENKINLCTSINVTLDVGTYTGLINCSFLNRITKLIVSNDSIRSPILLRHLTSLKTIDITWDLKKSDNKSLFELQGFKQKVNISFKFINTTDLTPKKATIKYDDIIKLQYLSYIANNDIKSTFADDKHFLTKLGKNITKFDIKWYRTEDPHADLTAEIVKYFPNLTWLNVGYDMDLQKEDLLKLHNLETLVISCACLKGLYNEVARLPKLAYLKCRMPKENSGYDKLPPVDFVAKCKKMKNLFLREPSNDKNIELCCAYETKLRLNCPGVTVMWYGKN